MPDDKSPEGKNTNIMKNYPLALLTLLAGLLSGALGGVLLGEFYRLGSGGLVG